MQADHRRTRLKIAGNISSSSWSQQASRGWYLLRYYRWSQMASRLAARMRQRRLRAGSGRRYQQLPDGALALRSLTSWPAQLERRLSARGAACANRRAAALVAGRFEFLGQAESLPDPIDWHLTSSPQRPHLWHFLLHYQEYLLDLVAAARATGDARYQERAWELITGWIAGNRPDDPRVFASAWHPYTISRRLPAWMYVWTAHPPADTLRDAVLTSIWQQARFLADHLEWDVRGNHLLENARGLLLAGAFLDCPEAEDWLKRGEQLLHAELPAQILPCGEHFERSPMYHAQLLETMIELASVLEPIRPEASRRCAATAAAMGSFLQQILHPDGQIPLLGDSALGEHAPPRALIAAVASLPATLETADTNTRPVTPVEDGARVIGDYWTFRHADDFLLFDAGPAGADHLPAHAHADLLSMEISLGGRRLVVDSGVYEYAEGPMRDYCRGTAAHNAMEIDGLNQCDVWSRFRMGYRGWPGPLTTGQSEDFHWAQATHNAYRRVGVPDVGRWIACRAGGPWFSVDWADGRGWHHVLNRLHLEPSVTAEKTGPDEVALTSGAGRWRLQSLGQGELTIADGWYCPRFGLRTANKVVTWTVRAALPCVGGWSLSPWNMNGRAALDRGNALRPVLTWHAAGKTVTLNVT